MSAVHHHHRHLDVACELDGAGARDRAEEWLRLRADHGLGVEPIPGGARIWLRPGARPLAVDLAGREASCCGFLDVDLEPDGDRLRLDLTSPAPEAREVIAHLAGIEPGRLLPADP